MKQHCNCCRCQNNTKYQQLNSVEEQISFLNTLSTIDRLLVIVNDTTYTHIDELLTETKVLDMKKLLYHIKARYEMQDCDNLHTFTDIADEHINEIAQLIAKYIIFQIDILDDYFDLHYDNQQQALEVEARNQNELNLAILAYMFQEECEFILNCILQTKEQKENYVNILINRYYIYKDCFHAYVTNDTIKTLVEFHL
jgi:hypothetical protein